MITLMCPYCEKDITIEDPFSKMLEDITCPYCKNISDLYYEEDGYDGDHDYFYLEKR